MEINFSPLLKNRTTLGIGGRVNKEYVLEKEADALFINEYMENSSTPFLILGGGSNLLISDEAMDCIVVSDRIGAKIKPSVERENESQVWLNVHSGLMLPVLLSFCEKHGFSGLEGLVGIPGRVGGAIAMNAGAFGCEIGSLIDELNVCSVEKGLETRKKEDFYIEYRTFKPKFIQTSFIITKALLCLEKKSIAEVREKTQANLEKKKNTQPLKLKTAGCVYKNPVNTFAGKLLEEAGFKGYRLRNMGFSQEHANFMANYGDGTFKEAIELMEIAEEKIKTLFGIALEREIKVYNGFTR